MARNPTELEGTMGDDERMSDLRGYGHFDEHHLTVAGSIEFAKTIRQNGQLP